MPKNDFDPQNDTFSDYSEEEVEQLESEREDEMISYHERTGNM